MAIATTDIIQCSADTNIQLPCQRGTMNTALRYIYHVDSDQ